jgi:hypothetical protein
VPCTSDGTGAAKYIVYVYMYIWVPPQALCDVVGVPQGFFVSDKMTSLDLLGMCFAILIVFDNLWSIIEDFHPRRWGIFMRDLLCVINETPLLTNRKRTDVNVCGVDSILQDDVELSVGQTPSGFWPDICLRSQ